MVKKAIVEEETATEATEEAPFVNAEPAAQPEPAVLTVKAPEPLKVKVKVGTLMFEKGTFERGATIEVSEEEYNRLKDLVILI